MRHYYNLYSIIWYVKYPFIILYKCEKNLCSHPWIMTYKHSVYGRAGHSTWIICILELVWFMQERGKWHGNISMNEVPHADLQVWGKWQGIIYSNAAIIKFHNKSWALLEITPCLLPHSYTDHLKCSRY